MHHRLTAPVVSLLATFAAASAQVALDPANRAQPETIFENYDARFNENGGPIGAVLDSLAKHPPTPALERSKHQLLKGIAGAHIDTDPLFGTPGFIRSWQTFLSAPNAKLQPLDAVHNFVADYAPLFEIDAAEVTAARITRNFTDAHNGVTHLTLQQQVKGIDLFNCGVKASVMPDGRLITISSTMIPRPAGDFAQWSSGMTDLDAIRAAAASVDIAITQDPKPAEEPAGLSAKRSWINSPDFNSPQPITTEKVLFPFTLDDIRPAWWVTIPKRGEGHTYELVIDARDGTVLHRKDELNTEVGAVNVLAYNGRGPMCSPNTARTLMTVNPSATAPASPFGWLDNNGATGADFTDTRGNNVDAHLDRDANNVADPGSRPDGGSNALFVFPLDLTQSPTAYQPAAVAQAFWFTNNYHDRLYAYGFTEAAGNFQTNNYGRGGAGNDPVQMDCQDGSGTNNANFGTPADGQSGRCQMYLWTTTPNRDGDLDASVIYHELTHGLSNRLTGGPANASALNNLQSGGMGEGWSDFVALCLIVTSAEDPVGAYPVGTYVLGQSCTSVGIRRKPYSYNMTTDPLTWDAFGTSGTTSYGIARSTEVHNSGELWCTSLWDIRAILYSTYGYAANQIILQLVVDAMKLQPANPSFTQARDAIISADVADYGGVHANAIWQAFARRGLGSGAVDVDSTQTTITLDTTVPASETGMAEQGDAGDMPATAQIVRGASNPTRISGNLAANDADMYRITICDRNAFTATTVGGSSLNTQLFLFDLSGNAITFNDDSGATTQSQVTGALVPSTGDYYLAISASDRDPVSSTGEIWADAPTTSERSPDGPGAGHPITGWTGTGAAGSYDIELTGVCAAVAPAAPVSLAAYAFATPEARYSACTGGNVSLTINVTPATQPTSTGITVSINTSAMGSPSVPLSGSSTGGNWTGTFNPGVLPTGLYACPFHVSDAQGRTFDSVLNFAVVDQPGTCCTPSHACSIVSCTACAALGGTFTPTQIACELSPCSAHPEAEPNDSMANATNASTTFFTYAGSAYQMGISGTITTSTDIDYFNIGPMQVGDVLTMSQSGSPSGSGSDTDSLVRLYRNGATGTVTSDDDSGPGFDSLVYRFSIATADTYFAAAYRANSTNTGTYQLGLFLENASTPPATGAIVTAEVEPNDTKAAPQNASNAWRQVQYVSNSSGVISTTGDNDYYAYQFTAGDVVSVHVISSSGLHTRLNFRDSNGAIVRSEDGTSGVPGGDSVLYGVVIPTSGTYYVQALAASGTGAYSLIVFLSSTTPPPQPCGSADFNNDGDTATDADIEDFFACVAGNCCATCGSADFNQDGDTATDADIEAFFRVLAGGSC